MKRHVFVLVLASSFFAPLAFTQRASAQTVVEVDIGDDDFCYTGWVLQGIEDGVPVYACPGG